MHLVRNSSTWRALLTLVVRHTRGHGMAWDAWMLLHAGRMTGERWSHTRHHVFSVSIIHSVDIDVSFLRTISCARDTRTLASSRWNQYWQSAARKQKRGA